MSHMTVRLPVVPAPFLADCEHCGHFQDWATTAACSVCGWPDELRMKWRAEFLADEDAS